MDTDTLDERGGNIVRLQVGAALIGLYAFIVAPILRADRYCNDDLKRSLFGRTGWDSNGRPLTSLVMKLLQSYDHSLVDISPLTQFGAVLVLSFAGSLLAERFRVRPWWLGALLTFPLGAQPFFLENLSYKFDSLTMSLAVLLSVLPISMAVERRPSRWLGILALFAGLCFYQPAFNVFLVLACVEFVVSQVETRDFKASTQRAMNRAFQALAGFGFYEIIVGIHVNGWVKAHSQPVSSWQDVEHIKVTVQHFAQFVGACFGQHWWLYFGPVLIAFVAATCASTLHVAVETRRRRTSLATIFQIFANLFVPIIALLAVLGPMLVLVDPPVVPRVLIGVGALLSGGLIVTYCVFREWSWTQVLPTIAGMMLAIGMSTIASAYGNAAGDQQHFEDHIAATLADDVAELQATRGVRRYLIDGSAGLSPVASHIVSEFPLVSELLPPFLNGEDLFHTHMFLLFYMPGISDYRDSKQEGWNSRVNIIIQRSANEPVVLTRKNYVIRVVQDIAVVRFLPTTVPTSSHRLEPADSPLDPNDR